MNDSQDSRAVAGQTPISSLGSREVNDSFAQWSRELARTSLLTRDEETELAKRMEQDDQEARDRFIESNLKLVVNIAKRYRGCGVPMEDIIQEGNLGLVKAIDHFDYRKGCRFSTIGVAWIEGQIRRSIENSRNNIRLPLYVLSELRKLYRVSNDLMHQFGRRPDAGEIADAMAVPVEHVNDLLSIPPEPVSLDETPGEEVDRFQEDLLEDPFAVDPDDAVLREDSFHHLRQAVSRLGPKHRAVIRMRYGLDGEVEHTLEEIGKKLNLTRQRVWQIEASSLRRIRNHHRSEGN